MAVYTKLPPILSGQRFGRLTAIEFAGRGVRGVALWTARCDCGTTIIANAASLKNKSKMSCGCLRSENGIWRGSINGTHRMSKTPEYAAWHNMRDRCLNETATRFHDYGGRGITICERWNEFENFYADMGPRPSQKHSLDRIDNEGNYEPSNCKWSTSRQQAFNRRRPATASL